MERLMEAVVSSFLSLVYFQLTTSVPEKETETILGLFSAFRCLAILFLTSVFISDVSRGGQVEPGFDDLLQDAPRTPPQDLAEAM